MDLLITIIGFGNIGKQIASLLLNHNNITINIIDPDNNIKGAILDMNQANQLYNNQTLVYNDFELFNQSDFIFHCAGASVPKGESRLTTSKLSIEITKAIFKDYQPKKNPFIIVVANPVEIIATITHKITGLPKQNIIGTGTFLDSLRMNFVVKSKLNKNNVDVNSILLGEHGDSVYLSEQLSQINNRPLNHYFSNDELLKMLREVKRSAFEIKKTQSATIYGVSHCAVKIFYSLLSPTQHKIPVSTSIPNSLKQFAKDKSTYVSLLANINNIGAFFVEDYLPNEKEAIFLQKSVDIIESYTTNF